MEIISRLAQEFEISAAITERVVALLDEGNTVPFIARYRKEQTGAMDDQKLRELSERLDYLRSLDKRREQIEGAIDEQGRLTDELRAQLAGAQTLAGLEDIYRHFKPKRRTRAMNGTVLPSSSSATTRSVMAALMSNSCARREMMSITAR